MKFLSIIIYSCLLSFVFLLHGPYFDQQNFQNYDDPYNGRGCDYYSPKNQENLPINETLNETLNDTYEVFSKSDCIDKDLYSKYILGNKFYSHCCYIRYLSDGTFYNGCVGLREDEYLDIFETIDRFERGNFLWGKQNADVQENMVPSKTQIYDLDCQSSFIYLSLTFIISLLGLF